MTFNIDQNWRPWSISQIKKCQIQRVNGIKVIKIPALTLLPTRFIFKTNFIPGKFIDHLMKYDVIHFHNDIDLSFPLFSFLVDKPKIFHCHLLNITYNSYRRNPIPKYILKNTVNLYIVPSSYTLRLLTDLSVPVSMARVIPNGIDVKKFYPLKKDKIRNLIVFVGRLHPTKGLHVLLEALKYLKSSIRLVVIGRPSSRYGYFKRIVRLIRMINEKSDHTVIYLGTLKPEEIRRWYQKASICVCPSLSESFGIANLEAMACATPVVASNVGGIPEVVSDHKTGILVPPNNPVKLADAIHYLLDNDSVRRKFGQEGHKHVVQNFSSEAVAKKLVEIYLTIKRR